MFIFSFRRIQTKREQNNLIISFIISHFISRSAFGKLLTRRYRLRRGSRKSGLVSAFGKCSNYDKCKQMVNIDLAKYVLSGEITITNDVTLTADAEVVDSVFGDGVSALHNAQPDKITEKFLELRNISVLYDKKSSRLVAIEQK